jgi:hypothetical protein
VLELPAFLEPGEETDYEPVTTWDLVNDSVENYPKGLLPLSDYSGRYSRFSAMILAMRIVLLASRRAVDYGQVASHLCS